MKVAIFQHTKSETAGYFETILTERKIPYEYVRLYETGNVQVHNATHFLFMGGPMSVNDEKDLPSLKEEKALIRGAVGHNRPVLGICLGAQLIASAFGARVYPFRQETGWCRLKCEPDMTGFIAGFPETFMVFQLHGETFDLPSGATLLCIGDIVKNQGFIYKTAIGLQFHLELDETMIKEWAGELDLETRERIIKETPGFLYESNRLCRMIAGAFLG
ncbi:MAG: type 1 glutamine amidotransferase [Methanoregula sp.]|uniref:type 1 glutamine amidotransferase n=1 Tax=Methanoregula sp. TaxID=2052170 RepID=UPI003BAFB584